MKPTLLILAAGIGSRYGGLKQVDGMGPGGEAILEFSVYDAIRAGFGKVVFVIRRDIEAPFREIVGKRVEKRISVEYVFQEYNAGLEWMTEIPHRERPWGTGHAVYCAREVIQEPFVAINADDFYGAEAFQVIGDFLRTDCSPDCYGMVAYELSKTLSENGTVSRGVCSVNSRGYLDEVIERTKIDRFAEGICFLDEQGEKHLLAENTPVSMNFWGFHHQVFQHIGQMFRDFVETNANNPKAEFYIPTVASTLIHAGTAQLKVLTSSSQWFGVTYPADKETVQKALAGMVAAGVYPSKLD